MEYRWVNKRVNLKVLVERIESFFLERNFRTTKEVFQDTVSMIASMHSAKEGAKRVTIEISQKPNGLTVKFEVGRNPRSRLPIAPLISFLGLGLFLKKDFDAGDFYQKLEDGFWSRLEEVVSEQVA